MATNSLIVLDGTGATKAISAFSGTYGFIPEHVISGSVTVTASATNPVYVTGSVNSSVTVADGLRVTASVANPLQVTGTVNVNNSSLTVTASSINPVYVTGAVSISQPVSVDVVVGDNIFVTSSLTAPLYISSSTNSPVLVTGTVSVDNYPAITTITASNENPVYVTGSFNGLRVTSSFEQPLAVIVDNYSHRVTASNEEPVFVTGAVNVNGTVSVDNYPAITTVTASLTNPLGVTGTMAISGTPTVTASIGFASYGLPVGDPALVVKITGSSESDRVWVTGTVAVGGIPTITGTVNINNDSFTVTASSTSPVYVTGAVLASLASNQITASIQDTLIITSSNTNPVIIKQKTGLDTVRAGFSVYGGEINWASTSSANVSGTFILADSSPTRTALMFSNKTNGNLYVALGDNDSVEKNGFGLTSTSSAPFNYSFVVYPSGSYFADPSFIGVKHSGFFVSSSQVSDYAVTVYKIE